MIIKYIGKWWLKNWLPRIKMFYNILCRWHYRKQVLVHKITGNAHQKYPFLRKIQKYQRVIHIFWLLNLMATNFCYRLHIHREDIHYLHFCISKTYVKCSLMQVRSIKKHALKMEYNVATGRLFLRSKVLKLTHCDSIYIILWNDKILEMGVQISGCQGMGGGGTGGKRVQLVIKGYQVASLWCWTCSVLGCAGRYRNLSSCKTVFMCMGKETFLIFHYFYLNECVCTDNQNMTYIPADQQITAILSHRVNA